MTRYIIKRILSMIPILLAVAIIIFTLMQIIPGDPVSIAMSEYATAAEIEAAREALGYNRPFAVKLVEYLKNLIFEFDFGTSFTYNIPVGPELIKRAPKTMLIAAMSIILIVLIGVPVGIRAAVKANKPEDRISMFVCLLGVSMPTFWLAFLLILVFSLKLGWFPSNGDSSLKYYILPAIAAALNGIANIARQTRSSMLEVIRSDYVVTARAKGQSEHNVIYKHALPNALIPVITLCGMRFGRALGDTVILETIFSIAGLGTFLIDSIKLRDYNVTQGCVIFIAFMFSMIMLLVDIVYAFVDPRIRARYSGK